MYWIGPSRLPDANCRGTQRKSACIQAWRTYSHTRSRIGASCTSHESKHKLAQLGPFGSSASFPCKHLVFARRPRGASVLQSTDCTEGSHLSHERVLSRIKLRCRAFPLNPAIVQEEESATIPGEKRISKEVLLGVTVLRQTNPGLQAFTWLVYAAPGTNALHRPACQCLQQLVSSAAGGRPQFASSHTEFREPGALLIAGKHSAAGPHTCRRPCGWCCAGA